MKKASILSLIGLMVLNTLSFPVAQASEVVETTLIEDVDGLKAIVDDLDGHYTLANDIDLSSETWESLGDDNNPFTGVLDGDGYTIANLTIEDDQVGLFYEVDGGVVENVTFTGVDINTTSGNAGTLSGVFTGVIDSVAVQGSVENEGRYTGGLVGFLHQGEISNSSFEGEVKGSEVLAGSSSGGIAGFIVSSDTLTNNHAEGLIQGRDVGGLYGALMSGHIDNNSYKGVIEGLASSGGIVSQHYGGSLSAVEVEVDILSETSTGNTGGVVGTSHGVIISDVNANVNIQGADYTGGVAGQLHSGSALQNVVVTGDIQGGTDVGGAAGSSFVPLQDIEVYSDVRGTSNIGGVVGYQSDNHLIQNMIVEGDIESTNGNNVGGIAGQLYGDITDVEHTGEVKGASQVGGIAGSGYLSDTADNLTSIGNVQGLGEYVGGLFGVVRGDVLNSTHTGDVTGGQYTGGAIGALDSPSVIRGVIVEGDVTSSSTHVGGIAGMLVGDLHDSTHTGNVSGTSSVGGLLGSQHSLTSAEIRNSISIGDVEANGNNVGGIAGESFDTTVIEDVYSFGNIRSENGSRHIGGLVPFVNNATVTRSGHEGDITTNTGTEYLGGLVGQSSESVFEEVYVRGNITTADGSEYVGGLIGQSDRNSIKDAYFVGDVGSEGFFVSGVLGFLNYDEGDQIENVYHSGSLVNDEYSFTIFAIDPSDDAVINSYWNSDLAGVTTSDIGTPKTTEELKQVETFENWDFEDTWGMHPHNNDGFPYFGESYVEPDLVEEIVFFTEVVNRNTDSVSTDTFDLETDLTQTVCYVDCDFEYSLNVTAKDNNLEVEVYEEKEDVKNEVETVTVASNTTETISGSIATDESQVNLGVEIRDRGALVDKRIYRVTLHSTEPTPEEEEEQTPPTNGGGNNGGNTGGGNTETPKEEDEEEVDEEVKKKVVDIDLDNKELKESHIIELGNDKEVLVDFYQFTCGSINDIELGVTSEAKGYTYTLSKQTKEGFKPLLEADLEENGLPFLDEQVRGSTPVYHLVIRDGDKVVANYVYNVKLAEVEWFFKDVSPNYWAYDAINNTKDKNIIVGSKDANCDVYFRPTDNITRGEAVAILIRYLEVDPTDYEKTDAFYDVDKQWFSEYVSAGHELGIVKGYVDGSFGGTKNINRASASAMISRMQGYESHQGVLPFKDVKSNFWAHQDMLNLYSEGVITGYKDGTFKPNQSITRAEFISMIDRLDK